MPAHMLGSTGSHATYLCICIRKHRRSRLHCHRHVRYPTGCRSPCRIREILLPPCSLIRSGARYSQRCCDFQSLPQAVATDERLFDARTSNVKSGCGLSISRKEAQPALAGDWHGKGGLISDHRLRHINYLCVESSLLDPCAGAPAFRIWSPVGRNFLLYSHPCCLNPLLASIHHGSF